MARLDDDVLILLEWGRAVGIDRSGKGCRIHLVVVDGENDVLVVQSIRQMWNLLDHCGSPKL